MPRSKSERKLIIRFWERTLKNIIRESVGFDTEEEVRFLAEKVMADVHPNHDDLYFNAVYFDTFGIGLSKTKDNEHWAKDAVEDAISHIFHIATNEKLLISTMLLAFTIGNEKLADHKGKSIMEVVDQYEKRYPHLNIKWGVSVDESFKDEARVFMVLNYDLPLPYG